MREPFFASMLLTTLVLSLWNIGVKGLAHDVNTERMIRDALQPPTSPLNAVNDFIAHSDLSHKKPEQKVLIRHGQIFAQLITPLNSSFNLTGDDVQAVVLGSSNQNGKPWLEEGTILEGCVEASVKATYGQTDGSLTIRFYKARWGDKQIDLFTASDTDDGTIKAPSERPLTKKQQVRGILMSVTKMAIPAAIGTGGMSVAITTGAGAVIGAAFADKGKRIKGAARGAWEGAGLNIFDPVVCKGESVILAQGTPIQLQLTESILAPKYVGKIDYKAKQELEVSENTSANITQITTHAQILQPNVVAKTDAKNAASQEEAELALATVNRKITQNDLAGALSELKKAEELFPDNIQVKQKHTEIYNLISGKPTQPIQ